MKKTLTMTIMIEKCGDCPHFKLGFLSEPPYCNAVAPEYKFTKYSAEPPEWCPLENAKD